jgi:hypothetical protein
VLAGSAAALAAIQVSDHSLAAALIAGAVVGLAALAVLMRIQRAAWERAATDPLFANGEQESIAG